MWQDPIVQETRALREQYAQQFNHDPVAIYEDIVKRQAAPGKKLVSFPPRRPVGFVAKQDTPSPTHASASLERGVG
ncbi:MAG: hypothetical protein IPH35_05005 [Rhodoferax sp.]|nr:hypothetical protein [Rhodoferax sp.]